MPKLNLINPDRKTNPQKKPDQFFTSRDPDGQRRSKSKYNKVFQDAGLNWFKAYEVLREFYWLEYDLISHDAVALYDTLHFLCKKNKEFTVNFLAKTLTKPVREHKNGKYRGATSPASLRDLLDELENAELLEIIKVRDELGARNDYIIKTPLYSKSDFDESKRKRILQAGEDIPGMFIEDEIERLLKNVTDNRAKHERTLLRQKDLKGADLEEQQQLQSAKEHKELMWKRLVHSFGNFAREFDRIVWHVIQLPDVVAIINESEYEEKVTRILKAKTKKLGLTWNPWFYHIAIQLRAFYEARLRSPRPAKRKSIKAPAGGVKPSAAAKDATTKIRKRLETIIGKKIRPNEISGYISYLQRCKKDLPIETLKAIAEPYFDEVTWGKIVLQL